MTTETIKLASVETDGGVAWTVALDLSRDSLERLFGLSLLDGEHFDSLHDAAEPSPSPSPSTSSTPGREPGGSLRAGGVRPLALRARAERRASRE